MKQSVRGAEPLPAFLISAPHTGCLTSELNLCSLALSATNWNPGKQARVRARGALLLHQCGAVYTLETVQLWVALRSTCPCCEGGGVVQ